MRSCRMSEPIIRPVDFWFMSGGVAIGSGRWGGFAQDCHTGAGCRVRLQEAQWALLVVRVWSVAIVKAINDVSLDYRGMGVERCRRWQPGDPVQMCHVSLSAGESSGQVRDGCGTSD